MKNIDFLKRVFQNMPEILEGITLTIWKKKHVEKVSELRLEICKACPKFSENMKKSENYTSVRKDIHCTNCGCNLEWKTRVLSQSCPENKWKALMTELEEEKIKETIENEKD